ncbi:MAG: potassium transporter TrkG, partial [Salaquimonas sp.]
MTSISQLTIVRIVSIFLLMLSAVMLIPLLIDLLDENPDWQVFAVVGGFTAFLSSYGIMITNDRPMPFNLPTGFVLINIMWVAISVVSALPYIFSDYHVSFTDAVFESVSGLTTTGSTVLSGLDDMPRGLLFWRSSTQWFGGVGFVAMGIVLLPFLQVGGMQFFKMESSDRSDKPFARIRTFGRALLAIYVIITLLCFLSYMLAGMSAFNAINHAMTTVSTGGFSTTDSSMMQQSGPVLVVGIIFMLAGAIPFTLYMSAIVGKRGRWSDGQMEVMLWIV